MAYNVNLNTSDISVANKIAKAIRFSSGGLRYVKSMGVELKARNLAQVSINLTDYEQTPMHRVYELVKREAERYGAMPVGSEIVGLVPKKAVETAAEYFLQLENFSPAQIFENKLQAALVGTPPATSQDGPYAIMARPFLDAVAQPSATPGGGSVSSFAGALAGALGQMVAGLSRKKKSQSAHVDKLFAGTGHTLDEMVGLAEAGKSLPTFNLPVSVKAKVKFDSSQVTSQNIIGLWEGSDKSLKSEYVVLSAHVDHLGIGDPVLSEPARHRQRRWGTGEPRLARELSLTRPLRGSPRRLFAPVARRGDRDGGDRSADYER